MEAFSDGVIAIIITIMVLEMKVPHGSGLGDLAPLLPVFLSYVLSFLYVGIYWNNHHHMLHACTAVTGGMLWANLHLLFWLSLFPFTTGWMGENHFTPVPTALYGVVLLMAAIAYFVLQQSIIRARKGLNLEKSDRARLEGQAITSAVYRCDRCYPPFLVDRPGDFRDRRADLADSGPAYRKASCHVTGDWTPTTRRRHKTRTSKGTTKRTTAGTDGLKNT
jgi:uncharacterized membrane protein